MNSGKLLGMVLYAMDSPHRRLVTTNLRFCFPHWPEDRIRRLRRDIFKHAGITILEIVHSTFVRRQDLLAMFNLTGKENLQDALQRNKGAIIVSAHLANWEMGFQFIGCYLKRSLTGIARSLRQKRLDRWLHHLRTRFGNRVLYKKDALEEMRRTLRSGEIVAFTMDQSRRKHGVEVSFLGRRTTVTPAAALLGMRCKSPVIPMFCLRKADYGLWVHVGSPLTMQKTGDIRADLQRNTQMVMHALEEIVRQYPAQWVWYQRLWKVTYPHLYQEWNRRRLRRKKKEIHVGA
ncbi:MAG: hypothetical protein JRJ12_07170 [Deltaproteobacteria bacterium]|nr:hypothetical protein [Deltaproteobacteria bacterium]MBW2072044.1 hypothetical protein [Deltaproteobacteria bacterium]